MRIITIDNQKWKWEVGTSNVSFVSPDGAPFYVSCADVRGVTWNVFERGQYKGTLDGMITPKHVKKYIKSLY